MASNRTPERTCIVCKRKAGKQDFIRIVKSKSGTVTLDKAGNADGRGAYVCRDGDCVKKLAKSRALNRAFKQNVPNEVYDGILLLNN
jgi:predicted RNA-binding protein YlxR (DUF448 family)